LIVIAKYYSGHQIKEHVMDGACSMHGVEMKCIQAFGGKPEGETASMTWVYTGA
jgi:hypothetical protein